jgi:hypothetical protein
MGFEIFTVVVRKSSVFWDITLCILLKVNGLLEEHGMFIFRVEE